ncbi:hypothetical protein DFJ74DRAFT_323644 [Hyaloraphidium curvatum]|nr:hypothetical protein DFJ74DRAFT_323644 [Hyaloraphidium curvatum]
MEVLPLNVAKYFDQADDDTLTVLEDGESVKKPVPSVWRRSAQYETIGIFSAENGGAILDQSSTAQPSVGQPASLDRVAAFDAQTSATLELKDLQDLAVQAPSSTEPTIPAHAHSISHLRKSVETSVATIRTANANALSGKEEYGTDMTSSVISDLVETYSRVTKPVAVPAADANIDLQLNAWASLGLEVTRCCSQNGLFADISEQERSPVDTDLDGSTAVASPTSPAYSSNDSLNLADKCRIGFNILKTRVKKRLTPPPALANPKSKAALAIADNVPALFDAPFSHDGEFTAFSSMVDSFPELPERRKEIYVDYATVEAFALLEMLIVVRHDVRAARGFVGRLKALRRNIHIMFDRTVEFYKALPHRKRQLDLNSRLRTMDVPVRLACLTVKHGLESLDAAFRRLVRGLVAVMGQIYLACNKKILSFRWRGLGADDIIVLINTIQDIRCVVNGGSLADEQAFRNRGLPFWDIDCWFGREVSI